MQFLVTGYDGKDEGAMDRRMAVRGAHMKLVETMKQEGRFLYAGALLDDEERMIGSVLFVDFPSREALDQWLQIEPYVTGDVWREIDVKRCKIPTIFLT